MPSTATDRLNGLTTSVAVKPPCRTATTVAITLAGLQTVGGVALAAGDRVLVKNQASAAANGIYVADTSAWTRAPDFDGALDAVNGTQVNVSNGGSTYFFKLVATDPVQIGSSALSFVEIDSTLFIDAPSGSANVGHTPADPDEDVTTVKVMLDRLTGADQKLQYLLAKMAAGETTNLACYGDSTTDGNETTDWTANPVDGSGNAVGAAAHIAPYAWPAKLQTILRAMFGNSNINVWNAGYSGREMADGWALDNYDRAITNNPDYGTPHGCFIDFGLNDSSGTGSDYEDHRTQCRLLIEKLEPLGTIPILLTCDPIARNIPASRDGRETSREIDRVKFSLGNEYRIPVIDKAADMRTWMAANRDGYRWGIEQADSLHFSDNGHALKAGAIAKALFRDVIVVKPGDGGRICSHDSRSNNIASYGGLTSVANVAQGTNENYSITVPTLTAMMTLWVWNESPDTEVIYRGIAHEDYAGSSITLCPKVTVTEMIGGVATDRVPCGVGFTQDGTAGTYRKSDLPYRVGHLPVGLSKVEYISGDDAVDLYFGNFELWQTPRECGLSSIGRTNCLRMPGPFQHSFSGSSQQSALFPEYRDGSNVYGLMGGDVVDIVADVTMVQGCGLIFTNCQTWKPSTSFGDRVYGMLYRHTDNKLRLHIGSVEAGVTSFLSTVLGESSAVTWTSDRALLRIRIDRVGSDQVISLWATRSAAGAAILTVTRTFSDGSIPWGGAVGGFFCNGSVGGTNTAVIHELTMYRR